MAIIGSCSHVVLKEIGGSVQRTEGIQRGAGFMKILLIIVDTLRNGWISADFAKLGGHSRGGDAGS